MGEAALEGLRGLRAPRGGTLRKDGRMVIGVLHLQVLHVACGVGDARVGGSRLLDLGVGGQRLEDSEAAEALAAVCT